MRNKGIIEYKEGFISKIKKFLKIYLKEKKKKMIMLQKYPILIIQKLLQTKKKANFLMI